MTTERKMTTESRMTTGIKNRKYSILLFVIALLIMSCDTDREFEEWSDLPASGWHKDSISTFQIDITDTLSEYNIILGLRNDNIYPYQNIWLFVKSVAPAGQSATDTFQIELATSAGKWHGSGWGSLYTTLNYYKPEVRFAQSGIYQISIQQGMRQNELKGIRSVGLRIENSK